MEKIKKYQEIVEKILRKKHSFPSIDFPSLKDLLVIDEDKEHFVQFTMGWKGDEYIHNVTFHIEVKKDGKVWIHENRTDSEIEIELIENGVAEEDIIGGMIEPYNPMGKAKAA